MNVTRAEQDGILTFSLEGRLDTTTSPRLHEELIPAIDGIHDVVLDFSHLEYVSSAGLRVLLAAQKQSAARGTSLTLTGVNDEIMEIFEMTGFIDILTIE
ncbi:STAS domain-containing protein [Collinsella ihumii]|uniref:Anti-sigma factor antagonist n=1 Tax=Collinsella ihumii TaxID=1720204 RepID=A0AAW7JUC7_9ACTN|nr:STAS domain-containing protein [Collinsella ihumii]MDN0069226.1 STAS domain-containing protein [Collinsella ihumii]